MERVKQKTLNGAKFAVWRSDTQSRGLVYHACHQRAKRMIAGLRRAPAAIYFREREAALVGERGTLRARARKRTRG
jgi:hypothetical protein